jgi:hypothetical protein
VAGSKGEKGEGGKVGRREGAKGGKALKEGRCNHFLLSSFLLDFILMI